LPRSRVSATFSYLDPHQSSPCPHLTFFNIILPYTPIPSKWPICLWYPYTNPVCTSSFRWCVLHVRPFPSSWFDHPNNILCEVQNMGYFITLSSLVLCHPSLRSPNILLSTLSSNKLSLCSSLSMRVQFSHTKHKAADATAVAQRT
jgi:hypothetical protein